MTLSLDPPKPKEVPERKKDQNVVSLRLSADQKAFIEVVREDRLPGETVKLIIDYLSKFDPSYTRKFLYDMERLKNG